MQTVVKTSLALTREEATKIAAHFQDILEDLSVTTIALVFDPERFVTSDWVEPPDVDCPFIAVEADPQS